MTMRNFISKQWMATLLTGLMSVLSVQAQTDTKQQEQPQQPQTEQQEQPQTEKQEPAKTEQQVQVEMLAHYGAKPLQAYHRWRGDGIWIRRNNMPEAYMKPNKMADQWKLKDGQMSKIVFKSGEERISRREGNVEYSPGRILKQFDFWELYIGGTLIGKVTFDGRMFDGKGHPCGTIEGPVDDDMVVYIYFVYTIADY